MDANLLTFPSSIKSRLWRSFQSGLVFSLLLIAAQRLSYADQALIEFNTEAKANPKARVLGGAITLSDRKASHSWNSIGDMNGTGMLVGTILKNLSGSAVDDVEITVTSKGDSINRSSSGGGLFTIVKFFDAAGKDVTSDPKVPAVKVEFEKGKGTGVPNNAMFWMLVPRTNSDFGDKAPKGKFTFDGLATPQVVIKGDLRLAPDPNSALIRNDANPTITFNKSQDMLTFLPGNVNFVKYENGTSTRTNNATESVIGSQITIDPMKVIGPSTITGAFRLGDSFIDVALNGHVFQAATLTNDLLIPDHSVPGFDSVLQSTLIMNTSVPNEASRYVSEMLDKYIEQNTGSYSLALFFRTDLLAPTITDDLTKSGMSTKGVLDVTLATAIPEPSSIVLAVIGYLSVVGYYCWRGPPGNRTRRQVSRRNST